MSNPPPLETLDGFDALDEATRLRRRTYDLLETSGRVIDVGCGSGTAVAEMHARGILTTGVDADPPMVDTAGRRVPEGTFEVADAASLPFADCSFGGYRAEKVLHALTDPDRAVAEARRVLAPGGRIVLVGQDWDAYLIDAHDAELTRTIVRARADSVPSPHAARSTRGLLLDAGFIGVTTEFDTVLLPKEFALHLLTVMADKAASTGAITGEQAGSWCTDQRHRAEHDRSFVAVPMVLTYADHPPA